MTDHSNADAQPAGQFIAYHELNYFPPDYARGFVSPLLEEDLLQEVRVLELGSGLGAYAIPFILALLQGNVKVFWRGYERNEESAWLFRALLDYAIVQRQEGWKRSQLLEHVATVAVTANRDVASQYHANGGLDLQVTVEDVERPANGATPLSSVDSQRFTVLFAPFFFHHLGLWRHVLRAVLPLMDNSFILVLGRARADWLLHDGLEPFLVPGQERDGDRTTLLFWRGLWRRLRAELGWVARELSACNSKPLLDTLDLQAHRVTEVCRSAVASTEWTVNANDLQEWILSGPATIWEAVTRLFHHRRPGTEDGYEGMIRSLLREAWIEASVGDSLNMRLENELIAYRIEKLQP